MPDFIKNRFEGGLNTFVEATKIGEAEYPFIRNARTRDGRVTPINKAKLDQPEKGNVQAIEQAGSYLIVFINGRAFYKNYEDTDPDWVQIPGLQMDDTVEELFTEVVPASSANNARTSSGNSFEQIDTPSPQGLIVQDGINDPWVIFSNGFARKLKNYSEWSVGDREYVPIGTQMAYVGGILWIVDPTRKILLRSVQGRPLDFGIVIDADGVMTEDAYAYSWTVSYDEITCIAASDLAQGALIITTKKFTYMVVPEAGGEFGQPKLSNVTLFSTGAINHKALVNVNGDFVFIDSTGLRSFNAVRQFNNEGGNSTFSRAVSKFFKGLEQSKVCAVTFDNYALFAVNTPYGYGVLLFDTITNIWAAFDQYTGVGAIKQFAEVKANNVRKLFFITEADEVYEAFGGTEVEEALLYLGEFYAGSAASGVSIETLRYVMTDVREAGMLTAQVVIDEALVATEECPVMETAVAENRFPLAFTGDCLTHGTLNLRTTKHGFKGGIILRWQFDAKLSNAVIEFAPRPTHTAEDERSRMFKAAKSYPIKINLIQPNVGTENAVITLEGSGLDQVTQVKLNTTACNIISQTSTSLQFVLPAVDFTGNVYLYTDKSIINAGSIN